jgi:hypothetical protein
VIALAQELRAEVERGATRLRALPEAAAGAPRGAGKWSPKEILGHLIDSAANNHQRFVRAQLAGAYVGPGYEQAAWVALHRYRERPWTELVDLWAALNRHLAVVIENLPADRLQAPCTVGERETTPLEWWMRDYLRHLRHHLAQIAAE